MSIAYQEKATEMVLIAALYLRLGFALKAGIQPLCHL